RRAALKLGERFVDRRRVLDLLKRVLVTELRVRVVHRVAVVLLGDLGELLGRGAVALHVVTAGVSEDLRGRRRRRERIQLDHLAEVPAHRRTPVHELQAQRPLLHLLEANGQHAVGHAARDQLAGEVKRGRTRRAVVVDVYDRDPAQPQLVDRLLPGRGVAVAVGGDGLFDLAVADAGVVERLRTRLL